MVLYDYLESKLDSLGRGKLTLTRSQYSEFKYDENEPPRVEPRQSNYHLMHSYIKYGVEHVLSLKINFNFSEATLSIYSTPSESTQNYSLKTVPLTAFVEHFSSDKVKHIYREVTSLVEALLNGFQTVPSGISLQPSVYVHRLFHGNVSFSISSELLDGVMDFKQYTSQETLLMKRVRNQPFHIGIHLQGNNRFFKDLVSFDPPYDSQDVWYKLEEIRR